MPIALPAPCAYILSMIPTIKGVPVRLSIFRDLLAQMLLPAVAPRPRPRRNSFDTVLIPTQLVVDTCYATFKNLEGKKLGEDEVKATWERRLAMLASNLGEEEQEEAFIVSKYDLVPETLADMVQVSFQPLLELHFRLGDKYLEIRGRPVFLYKTVQAVQGLTCTHLFGGQTAGNQCGVLYCFCSSIRVNPFRNTAVVGLPI